MTAASLLPAADELPGVVAGWWMSGISGAAQTAHRMGTSLHGHGKSKVTLCGRTLHVVRPAPESDRTPVCDTCSAKADRLATRPDAVRPPPPPVRRIPAATTGEQGNTVADRVARRVAFAWVVPLSDRALDYVPAPYGLDEAAQRAASLTGEGA